MVQYVSLRYAIILAVPPRSSTVVATRIFLFLQNFTGWIVQVGDDDVKLFVGVCLQKLGVFCKSLQDGLSKSGDKEGIQT